MTQKAIPKRVITKEMGEEMAKKYGMIHMEASAKTGDGVNEIFDSITGKIIDLSLPNLE